jgi:threonine dehydrogenase-like Zn-dependent dehydrogenase
MKAVCWMGKEKMSVESVPDPKILNPRDAIIRVTSTCICGSDLHLYDGYIPTMKQGDILGHEFMGEVVELGSRINPEKLKVGDRVVVPFTIACGRCFFCQNQLWSCCDNTNPNAWVAEKMMGFSPSGLFGYTHMLGGYAGGQAQYARVPFADVGPLKIPAGIPDEKVVFLSDIFPTGYMGAVNCELRYTKRRHRLHLGLRPRGSVRNTKRLPARSGKSYRDRSSSRTLAYGQRCRRGDNRF